MAFDIKIVVEAVDKASSVLQGIRERIGNLNKVTDQVATAAGGIGGAISSSQGVLEQFASTVNAIPDALTPLTDTLAQNATEFTGLAAGVDAGSEALASLEKAASAGAPGVSQVAAAIGQIEQKSQESAATTQATAKNIGALSASIKESGDQAQPASSAIGLINETLSRLAETTAQAVNSQALFAQSTARLAPILAQNARSLRLANEESARGIGQKGAKESAYAFDAFEGVLKRVGMTMKDVDRETQQGVSTWGRIRDVIGQNRVVFAGLAAAIASVPASLAFITRGAIATADGLDDLKVQTGLTVEFLSSLDILTRKEGTNIGEMTIGFKQLSRAMVEAVNPASESAKTFRALGIDVRTLTDDQKKLQNFLPILADGFTRLEDGTGKLAIAQAVLGRSGEKLIPLFNKGAAGFEAARQEASKLGLVVSGETAAAAGKLNDRWTELGAVFRGLGNQIAVALLPALTQFVAFATRHSEVVKYGFLGIATAITAIGLAIAAVKVGTLIDGLLTALAGPAALARVTSMSGLIGTLTAGFRNLLAPIGAAGAAAGTSFGASMLAKIGAVGFILGGTVVIIDNVTEAWKRYKAAQKEALATQALADNNTNLRGIVEKQISEFEQQGKITTAKANEFRNRLFQAFQPVPTKEAVTGTGFAAGLVTGSKTVFKQDAEQEASVMRGIIAETIHLVEARNEVTAATREAVNYSKTEIALAQSKLDIFRAQKDLELARIQEDQDRPYSSVTVDETVRRQTEILTQVKEAEEEFLRKQSDIQIAEIRRLAASDPRFADAKNKAAAKVAIEAEASNDIRQVEAQRDADLARSQANFDQRLLELTQQRVAGEIEVEKRGAQNRLEVAQIRNEELLAAEIELQQTIQRLREEQKNLPDDQRLTEQQIQEAALFQFQRNSMLIRERQQKALLDLKRAEIEANKALVQSDPSPDLDRKQSTLNDLLRQHNALLAHEIALNREVLNSGKLSMEETIERRRRIIELQTEIVINNRAANIQDPTNLPRLQSDLGFQNQLKRDGSQTGERELIAPFRALDDFLSGTLQTTFNGLSQSLAGLATGANNWAQVWQQAGNQIIGMIIQLILEYTLFHAIRSALDKVFHSSARTNIGATAAAGKAAQTAAAATAATSAGTVAAASAPAAAATSIWSFGSSAAIGLVLALAAIGAIVAALAFKAGGVVPQGGRAVERFATGGLAGSGGIFSGPGGETEDKIATRARPGTGILTAAAVRFYGGQRFVTDLVSDRLPMPPSRSWRPPSGADTPIRVSPGEAWLAPEVVAKLGGPKVIAALNARKIPPYLFSAKMPTVAAPGAAGGFAPKFAGGGIAGVLRAVLPDFHEGAPARPMALTHLDMPEFESGGVVGLDAGGSARASQINELLLQAQVENNPTVNVPAPEIYLLKRTDEIKEVLSSSWGRKFVFDTVHGMKTELGVRS